MCKCSEVQDFIRKVDYTFYQNLVEVLMPNVLRPIPSELIISLSINYVITILIVIQFLGSLTQSIRNFAKGLESWLTSAMADCPEEMTQIKVYILFYLYLKIYFNKYFILVDCCICICSDIKALYIIKSSCSSCTCSASEF